MEYLNLKSQYESIKNEIEQAIKNVFEKGTFIGGQEVSLLEKEIAEFCGVKNAISVNSGTDALFLSLKALGIKEGDEVITTPFTFIATAEVIANCGAKPVFVDIDSKTFNIDSKKIEEKITKNTKAIIPVHLYGQMSDIVEISKIAKKHNIFVVEDAAQAIGSETKGVKPGKIGDLACLSFFPSKNLGAYGDGGMIITNNDELALKLRTIKNHGSSPTEKYRNLVVGVNSRLDSIQAAVLRVKLNYLTLWNKKRRELADYYSLKLSEIKEIKTPPVDENSVHVFNQYTLRAEKRSELVAYMKEKNVPSMIYYPLPLHLQPCFEYLGYKKGDFLEAEKTTDEVLSLPLYPELKREDQNLIIETINNFYGKKD
jgi:dTDP-4-amino-4,6-dideoxygalactose transaminase